MAVKRRPWLLLALSCTAFIAAQWRWAETSMCAARAEPPRPLRERLEQRFNEVMRNPSVPLLQDFRTYTKSLPVRSIHGQPAKLHDLPFWAEESDLQGMARALETPARGSARAVAKYVAAPGGSGKTASILPAFLESSFFTHYLYIACTNNENRRFNVLPSIPSTDPFIAEKQGAAFAAECVRRLLAGRDDGPFEVPLHAAPPSLEDTARDLRAFLQKTLGDEARVLLHIDEHRHMCYRREPKEGPDPGGAAFSRGAFKALAAMGAGRGAIVATYTDAPPLPAVSSSGVCRDPVTLCCIDLDGLMRHVRELSFAPNCESRAERRLWATVRFRLGMKLRQFGVASLHRRGFDKPLEDFLTSFQEIKCRPAPLVQVLGDLAKHCLGSINHLGNIVDQNAAQLLEGVPEKTEANWERQVSDLVLISGKVTAKVTASLERLCSMVDPNVPVYRKGRNRFLACLDESELLASTPLETAYAWVLACTSARSGGMTFLTGAADFDFQCRDLEPGRLFPSQDDSNYTVTSLATGVLYYADEKRGGQPPHPLADLFFRTAKDELVLVDITGAGRAGKKRGNLISWIQREQPQLRNLTLRGVVLAPYIRNASSTHDGVSVVAGSDATDLLGGLAQVLRWLV